VQIGKERRNGVAGAAWAIGSPGFAGEDEARGGGDVGCQVRVLPGPSG
jgi:hypothetical protein